MKTAAPLRRLLKTTMNSRNMISAYSGSVTRRTLAHFENEIACKPQKRYFDEVLTSDLSRKAAQNWIMRRLWGLFSPQTLLQWLVSRHSGLHSDPRILRRRVACQAGTYKINFAIRSGIWDGATVAVHYCSFSAVPLAFLVADPSAIPQHLSA